MNTLGLLGPSTRLFFPLNEELGGVNSLSIAETSKVFASLDLLDCVVALESPDRREEIGCCESFAKQRRNMNHGILILLAPNSTNPSSAFPLCVVSTTHRNPSISSILCNFLFPVADIIRG